MERFYKIFAISAAIVVVITSLVLLVHLDKNYSNEDYKVISNKALYIKHRL